MENEDTHTTWKRKAIIKTLKERRDSEYSIREKGFDRLQLYHEAMYVTRKKKSPLRGRELDHILQKINLLAKGEAGGKRAQPFLRGEES